MLNMVFGTNLKNLMRERNITQSQLATQIGYTQRAVSKWVNNQTEPTETAIIKCAEFFGVSCDELLCAPENITGENPTEIFASARDKKTDEILRQCLSMSEEQRSQVLGYIAALLDNK